MFSCYMFRPQSAIFRRSSCIQLNYFIRILISFDELCYTKDCVIKKIIRLVYYKLFCSF
jgi:hypothetical protein